MKSIHIILFFLSFVIQAFWQSLFAFELPAQCQEKTSSDCIACTNQTAKKALPTLKAESLSSSMQTLGTFAFLEDKVSKLAQVNEALKQSLVPLFRTLRDGQSEPTYKKSREEIAKIKEDYERLTVLSREAIILQRKFNYCTTNCSVTWRMQIEDEIKVVQKLKTALFVKQPILANKVFEEQMGSIPDKMLDDELFFSNDVFESKLKDALFDNLGKIQDRGTEFFKFQNDGKKPFNPDRHEGYVKDYIAEATSRFPGIMEDVVKSSYYDGTFTTPSDLPAACFYAEQFKKYSTRKEYEERAVDAGLFILPLFAGPLGRAGAFGAELAFGERLAVWGLRSVEVKNAVTASGMVFQAGVVARDLDQLKDLSEKCRRSEVRFLSQSNESQLNDFRDCQKDLGDKMFATEFGLISLGATNLSPVTIKFLSKGIQSLKAPVALAKEVKSSQEISGYIYKNGLNELKKGQMSVEFKTPDNGVFSVMDLSNVVKSGDPAIKKIPEDYWRYVGGVYSERLNLTKTEIDGFIKSSVEMSPRTKLILSTEKSPMTGGPMKINGGVGLVEAQKTGDLLPLEKATGVRITRKPDEKIVEIVRLTVGKDVEAEKMSSALVTSAASLIAQDKSVSRVFIFTSKIHARLYKRMGIPADKIKDLDKRDVLIEFTRDDLEKILQKKAQLEKASSLFIRRARQLDLLASAF